MIALQMINTVEKQFCSSETKCPYSFDSTCTPSDDDWASYLTSLDTEGTVLRIDVVTRQKNTFTPPHCTPDCVLIAKIKDALANVENTVSKMAEVARLQQHARLRTSHVTNDATPRFVCPSGYRLFRNVTCVACPAGYHYPRVGANKRCLPCPQDTYQELTAEAQCKQCEEDTGTDRLAAISALECQSKDLSSYLGDVVEVIMGYRRRPGIRHTIILSLLLLILAFLIIIIAVMLSMVYHQTYKDATKEKKKSLGIASPRKPAKQTKAVKSKPKSSTKPKSNKQKKANAKAPPSKPPSSAKRAASTKSPKKTTAAKPPAIPKRAAPAAKAPTKLNQSKNAASHHFHGLHGGNYRNSNSASFSEENPNTNIHNNQLNTIMHSNQSIINMHNDKSNTNMHNNQFTTNMHNNQSNTNMHNNKLNTNTHNKCDINMHNNKSARESRQPADDAGWDGQQPIAQSPSNTVWSNDAVNHLDRNATASAKDYSRTYPFVLTHDDKQSNQYARWPNGGVGNLAKNATGSDEACPNQMNDETQRKRFATDTAKDAKVFAHDNKEINQYNNSKNSISLSSENENKYLDVFDRSCEMFAVERIDNVARHSRDSWDIIDKAKIINSEKKFTNVLEDYSSNIRKPEFIKMNQNRRDETPCDYYNNNNGKLELIEISNNLETNLLSNNHFDFHGKSLSNIEVANLNDAFLQKNIDSVKQPLIPNLLTPQQKSASVKCKSTEDTSFAAASLISSKDKAEKEAVSLRNNCSKWPNSYNISYLELPEGLISCKLVKSKDDVGDARSGKNGGYFIDDDATSRDVNLNQNNSMDEIENQSINQLMNKSVNQSVNQPISQLINQPLNELLNQPINQLINQPINQSINQPINQSIIQHINHSIESINQTNSLLRQTTLELSGATMREMPSGVDEDINRRLDIFPPKESDGRKDASAKELANSQSAWRPRTSKKRNSKMSNKCRVHRKTKSAKK